MNRILEIRTMTLKPGTGAEFLRLFQEALPLQMQKRWGVDVITYGLSLDRPDVMFSVRAYDSLEHREQSQETFYSSPEWRQGPREGLVSRIESYVDAVLELSNEAIDALRKVHY
jgi:hypothetical protein